MTTVQGVPREFDQKRILKALKKDFACNGTIVKDLEMGEVIQLQGDQRLKVSEFLTTQLPIQKKSIKIHGYAFLISLNCLYSLLQVLRLWVLVVHKQAT